VPTSTVARARRPWNGAAAAGVGFQVGLRALRCGSAPSMRSDGLQQQRAPIAFTEGTYLAGDTRRMTRKPEPRSRSFWSIYKIASKPSGSAKSRQVAMPAIGLLYRATPHAVRVRQLVQMVVLAPLGGSRRIGLRP
jgi:hypothetical protein